MPSPPSPGAGLPRVYLLDCPILAGAVACRAGLGADGRTWECGGIQVRVCGGVFVVVASEAGCGARALRCEVIAQCCDRSDVGLRQRKRERAAGMALRAV